MDQNEQVEIVETWIALGRTEVDLKIGRRTFRVTVDPDGHPSISNNEDRVSKV